jgi:hypothetical protein
LLIARLIAGFEAPAPAVVIGLMILSALLLLTLSLLGSTLLPTLANGVVVFSLFGLAWLAGVIEFIGGTLSNQAMVNLGIAVSLLVPSDGLWRAASFFVQPPALLALSPGRLASPFTAVAPPTAPFLWWSAAYVVVCLLAAVRAFARRDL